MKSRNTSYKVVASFVLGSVAAGSCFAQFLDRNFQRFDRATSPRLNRFLLAETPESWLEGAFSLTLPDSQKSYSGSLSYTSLPHGLSQNLGKISSTTTYTHANPSGGATSDTYKETIQYQLSKDENGGLTFGFIGSAVSSGGPTTYIPSLSVSSFSKNANDPTITPTISWMRVNSGAAHVDGFIPDIQIQVPAGNSFEYSADYTFPTRVGGPSAFQLDGIYTITPSKAANKKSGELSLEGSMSVSQAFNPGYMLRLAYKF